MTLERLLDLIGDTADPEALYTRIDFPAPSEERPYVFINMVATVDGKIVLGEPGGTAKGVGGPTDQRLFRRLQGTCDGAIIGSTTLRASNVIYPPVIYRFVVTRSGEVPLNNRFISDAPDKAYVLGPEDMPEEIVATLRSRTHLIQAGKGDADLPTLLRRLRQEFKIERLLCEGGASLNDQLLRAGLVDELFLTIAPKLKGGAHLPGIVAGEGFPSGAYLGVNLLSVYHDESELYLRYRLEAAPHRT